MNKQEIAKTFRDAADKLEKDETWTDNDVVAVGTAARLANNYHLNQSTAAAGGNVISREAFDQMGATQKAEFMRNQGRVVDVPKV